MAGSGRRIEITFLGNSSNLDRTANGVESRMSRLGNGFKKFGIAAAAGFAVAGAGIAAWGVTSVKSLARIEKINAQTQAVVASTGGAAGVTAKHVEDLAGSLENLTASEAESIQEGANLLLTFTNVKNAAGEGNDVFDQSVGLMNDMSVAMGTDMKSSSMLLGKALNNPVKGLSALSRAGVQFTDGQKKQITAMVEAGDTMGAQKIMLAELTNQFGGSGEAFAKTAQGKVELAKHAFGTLGETIFANVLPPLGELAGKSADLLNGMAENWGPFVDGMKQRFAPAIDTAQRVLGRFGDAGRKAFELLLPIVKDTWKSVVDAGKRIGPALVSVWDALSPLVKGGATVAIGALFAAFKSLSPVIDTVGEAIGRVGDLAREHPVIFGAVAAAIAGITAAFLAWKLAVTAVTAVTKAWAIVQAAMNVVLAANPIGIVVLALAGLAAGLAYAWKNSETFRTKVTAAWNNIKSAVSSVMRFFTTTIPAALSYVGGKWHAGWSAMKASVTLIMGAIRTTFSSIWGAISGTVGSAINNVVGAFRAIPGRILGMVGSFTSAGKGLIDGLLNGVANAGGFVADIAGNVWSAVKRSLNSAIDRINDTLDFNINLPMGIGSFRINAPNIPHFARGTKFAPGGLAVVGEQGPELVNLPRGSQVMTNRESMGAMRGLGGGGDTYIFNFNRITDAVAAGRELERVLVEYTRKTGRPLPTVVVGR